MGAIWEFLENFYAGVCVADINTHELIYMNAKSREWFQIPDRQSYQGKKCYAVLQNFTMPCPFCTNTELVEDHLYEWDYYNPVVNQTFHLKDYIVEHEGRKYRVEIAIPDDLTGRHSATEITEPEEIQSNFFINKCLMATHSVTDPSTSLELMLQYIGSQLGCDGVSLYEITDAGQFQSTYCWTPDDSSIPAASPILEIEASQYLQNLYRNEVLVFSDRDERLSPPSHFSSKPEFADMHALLISPVLTKGQIIGLLRLDNPAVKSVRSISGTIKVLAHFIGSIVLSRDLKNHLEMLSYHDPMTQLLNRHALNQYVSSEKYQELHSIGLIYCDLIGLKRINDNLGHNNGDRLILQATRILTDLFSAKNIYRIGGDEFLILCPDIPQKSFSEQLMQLRSHTEAENCTLSIGSIWSDQMETEFAQLLALADDNMYLDKLAYYQGKQSCETPASHLRSTAFLSFLQNYYFDADAFFQSIAMPEAPFYLYCGDVQHNTYYISDNLRDTFDFDSNLVYDFIALLQQRIYAPDRRIHEKELESMLQDKRTTHSIRYRIFDKSGQLVWIHCRGIMTWDKENEKPLFFSGSMIALQFESEVDPVTGLLNRDCAVKDLATLCSHNVKSLMLCFHLRNFSDINRTFGRTIGDAMLREIANALELELGEHFQIFRLDGVYFLVIAYQDYDVRVLADSIRQTILNIYRHNGIHTMYPCSIGILHIPQDGADPQELIDNILLATQNAKKLPSADFVKFSSYLSEGYREQTDISLALNYCVNHGFQGFRIVLQPQVTAQKGEIYGGEILLRWNSGGRDISPSKFVPLLEQYGLIVPVGKWLVTQVMQAARDIISCAPNFVLSFNVSYLQILDPTFFDYMKNAMHLYGIPGRNLMIELTETHFDEMPDHLENFINNCNKAGISFILDDFGTAYSSLHLLLQYPADLIKLDRTMMCELTSSPAKLNFMMSIIYACHCFGKKVCVEGVETEEELAIVRQTECDYIQGFYFHQPMELSEISHLLRTNRDKFTFH